MNFRAVFKENNQIQQIHNVPDNYINAFMISLIDNMK